MKKMVISLVLVVVVFLVGFLPQYFKAARLKVEVEKVKQDLASCEFNNRLAALRDLAALLYVEVSQKNYTVAGGIATQLFDGIRQTTNQLGDSRLRQNLQEILNLRDAITAKLATGDAAVVDEVQSILLKTHGSSKS